MIRNLFAQSDSNFFKCGVEQLFSTFANHSSKFSAHATFLLRTPQNSFEQHEPPLRVPSSTVLHTTHDDYYDVVATFSSKVQKVNLMHDKNLYKRCCSIQSRLCLRFCVLKIVCRKVENFACSKFNNLCRFAFEKQYKIYSVSAFSNLFTKRIFVCSLCVCVQCSCFQCDILLQRER